MSFFAIEPMGGIAVGGRARGSMRGGVPVGGVPVGGATMMPYGFHETYMPHMYEGGAMTKEEKSARAKEMKKMIAERAKELRTEVFEDEEGNEYTLGKNEALGKAKDQIQAEMMKERKVKQAKDERITKKFLRSRVSNMKAKEQKKLDEKITGYRSAIHTEKGKPKLTQEQLKAISERLTAEGYGVYDMVGGKWYDDLWRGVKKGAKIAEHALPFIL